MLEPPAVGGTIRVAVYDYLGPDAYAYPDPPDTLTALIPPESSEIDTILDRVRADPADPLAPRSLRVTVRERWTSVDLRSQTPVGSPSPSTGTRRPPSTGGTIGKASKASPSTIFHSPVGAASTWVTP
jgi:hypothetical protein